ncbi:MAG: hypothetical protein HKO89_05730 [Saprospiraceae bacterium]|nr:hypothetical protein [Saprospiraceae bacterium]
MKKINGLVLVVCLSLGFNQLAAQENVKSQFDFWIGEWDVYKYGTDTLVGKSKISSILDGHGIIEEYEAIGSKYRGTSLNKYNQLSGQWEQYYIDNSGLTLHLKGQLKEDKMILGNSVQRGEKTIQNRITWQAEPGKSSVRQTWTQLQEDTGNDKNKDSTDWALLFDGEYKPRSK